MSDIDVRKKQDLYAAFNNADTILMKKYVEQLEKLSLVDAGESIGAIEVGSNICLYHVDKIVYDKNENIHDKLTTVYSSVLVDENASLILLIQGKVSHVDLYLGVAGKKVMPDGTVSAANCENTGKTLESVLKGNFPGTELQRVDNSQRKNTETGKVEGESIATVIESCFNGADAIASVSGIAALRNQKESSSEKFVQAMEKLVDSMRGKEYAAIYIADVKSASVIEELCTAYEDIYSQLSPFKQSVQTLNKGKAKTDTKSLIEGVVDTTNESLAKAVMHGSSHAVAKTNSVNASVTVSTSVGASAKVLDASKSVAGTVGVGHSVSKTDATNEAVTDTQTEGKSKSLSTQNSVANAITSSNGEALQITYDNRAVKSLLDRIDEQIKRLRSCEDFGLFDCAVYFVSNKYENVVAAASAYKSLIRGENSSVESSAINVWVEEKQIEALRVYLERFYHPMFALQTVADADERGAMYLPVTPALMVSGKELAYQFSLPKKSIAGLPVIECAEFGRNVLTVDGKNEGEINIGKIYHMLHEESEEVKLSAKDMTAHAFVTGSTGAGKSNAIYKILEESVKLKKEDGDKISFMVIEPAKGEYKDVFGTNDNIKADVYGTNPKLTPLLRINPFRFPETTHVYEHMDRLVEIFNVCWSMYAAMPAVLKASLENAYKATGWDLEKSENITGVNIYPTFATVAQEVKKYLDKSEYSDENKGNYKGALLTRLESLANGINGMIFCADDIKDEELFDKNVIVDLSRVGSMDTKALIMGVLIMRLQEYRSGVRLKECQEGKAATNSGLRHITVLEEAHNLLKRTSTEQSAEGSNLIGKSVEMLANSIAEMRTYGEAFIIADQAPGLLDMSVIRNTNTKIVLRLPDYSDRELVGKAANMNEEQITELAKLKTGVAAVYQNNWVSPVLCQFERFNAQEKMYINPESPERQDKRNIAASEVLNIIMKSDIRKKLDNVDFRDKIIQDVVDSALPDWLKVKILLYIKTKNHKVEQLAKIAYGFFNSEESLEKAASAEDIEKWMDKLTADLKPSVKDYAEEEIDMLLALLVKEHYELNSAYKPIYLSYMEYIGKKRNLI